MSPKVTNTPSLNSLVAAPARKRETPPPSITFRKVMEGGAQLLLAGARVASRIVGGPFLAATLPATSLSNRGTGLPEINGGGSGGQGQTDPYQAFHEQRMNDELKLLALQDRIQRDNRQVTMVSNVMKARHETAKAAISNIRS